MAANFIHSLLIASALAGATLAAGAAMSQTAEQGAVPGEARVEPPTLNALGVEWSIIGDDNRNAAVTLAYRKQGEASWREGAPLLRMNGEVVRQGAAYSYVAPNMFAGSVFGLEPGTTYEIRLTLADPDIQTFAPVERLLTATTRPVPRPAEDGMVYHVYPRGYQGERQLPAFNSLMAAYNTGASGADFVNAYRPRVRPGDTILIHGGTYRETRQTYAGANSTLFDGTFYLTADGTAERPIVIKAAGDGEVIFDGDGAAVLFDMMAADYNYVEGITVRNTDTAFLLGRKGILGAVGFTLKNSRLENVGRGVSTDWGGARDFYIADNVFIGRNDQSRLMGWIGATWTALPGFTPVPLVSEFAVKVYGSGHVIEHNRIEFFHDGIDHASYGDPDGWPDNPVFANSVDIVGNDIRNLDDNCIEADGGAQNFRVIGNRCFNLAHRALSAQPSLGGPIYFIRNIVYNAPEGGAVKWTANGAGVLVYNNTFLTEVHQMGPFSNLHYRNNLIIGQGAKGNAAVPEGMSPALFAVETFTPWSSSDYNGFAPYGVSPTPFAWGQPADGVAAYTGTRQMNYFPTLAAYTAATGQDVHSVMLTASALVNAPPADRTDPTRLYDPANFDFSLTPDSAAIDKGMVIPGITDGFTGAAPDLGALERGAPAPIYGPRPLALQP